VHRRGRELDYGADPQADDQEIREAALRQSQERRPHGPTVSPPPAARLGREDDGQIILEDEAGSGLRPTLLRLPAPTMAAHNDERNPEVNAAIAALLEDEQVLHTNEAPAVVAARSLNRRFGAGDTAVDALRRVSLDIAAGELTAVMGPSGSGKSTLMHILAGLDKPSSGTVQIAGREITTMGDNELTKLRRAHIGFVFQFFNLLPMLTAEENVVLPLSIAGTKPERAWVDSLIQSVGLDGRRAHRPSELSGGQQQRVAIARALVSRPTVLFADEPTGNLDSATGADILALLRSSVDEHGQTIVMVTHDSRAAEIADRVLHLADGVIVREEVRTP